MSSDSESYFRNSNHFNKKMKLDHNCPELDFMEVHEQALVSKILHNEQYDNISVISDNSKKKKKKNSCKR